MSRTSRATVAAALGVRERIRRHLAENPGEVYTREGIARIFDLTTQQARDALLDLRREDFASSARVYFINPGRPR